MSQQPESGEFPALHGHAVGAWEALAGWWDETTGEADEFHRKLVIPATDRLLALRPGERVLDAACGNGGYARHLAAHGADVVAFDASRQLIELAERRTTERRDRIVYRHIDATDRPALLALGKGGYDAAVCKMALMDIAAIDPLLAALAELLKAGGSSSRCFTRRSTPPGPASGWRRRPRTRESWSCIVA
jgi:2-polyprenyl-3-methyl-5-hydroxy-6-metoxy-1,4-benzoquinol methylase